MNRGFKFKTKCVICGKITHPRKPKGGNGTLWYPRRHDVNGKACSGNIEEAEIIDSIEYIRKIVRNKN